MTQQIEIKCCNSVQKHIWVLHLIILLLVAMEKSYVLSKFNQWQNDHLILKGPLWLKKKYVYKEEQKILNQKHQQQSMFRRLCI